MLKKNRKMLKKIYKEEYAKAESNAKKTALTKEIDRIKRKAREDAKRKYDVEARRKARAKRMKNLKSGMKGMGKGMKKAGKHARRINEQIRDWY